MKQNNTLNGVKWNALNSLFSQATTIITGIVLMRLLSPNSFGLIGMITVFTGFLNVLKDSGLGSSLIYQSDITKRDKDTVFWFNIFIGFILFIIFFFSSKLLADYYNEPALDDLVKAFSLTFIFSAFSITQYSLLKKKMAFKKIFQVEIIGLTLSAILTIVAAYSGLGVWSLIILHISRTLIISINTWIVSIYKPTLKFSFKTLKHHFNYSFPVLGTKAFNYWTRNADNFFIGSFLGSQALGYYSRAYFFVSLPTQKITSIIGNVIFPSLSIIKEDKQSASELYLKAMRMTSLITFPLLGALIVFAEPFIIFVFGSQWLPMKISLQILCTLSLFKSVFDFTTPIFYSQGATTLNFKISMCLGISNILAFYIGSQYSIEMVATLLLIIYFIFIVPKIYYASNLINLSSILVLQNLLSVFLINVLSMFISYFFATIILNNQSNLIILILSSVFYLLIYLSLNYYFNSKQIKEFFKYSMKAINKT